MGWPLTNASLGSCTSVGAGEDEAAVFEVLKDARVLARPRKRFEAEEELLGYDDEGRDGVRVLE